MNGIRRWLMTMSLLGMTGLQTAAAPASAWLASAEQQLIQLEYHASLNDSGLQAPNRAQGFRTYFRDDGIHVATRRVDNTPMASLALTAYGRDGARRVLGPAEVVPTLTTAVLRWPNISARYQNLSDGLRQAVTIQQRPAGEGWLSLTLKISDAAAQVSADDVL